MKHFYLSLCCAGLLLCVASFASAVDMKWTGKISDSMCGANHSSMGSSKLNNHDCTVACVKAGAKYVFVSNGKVYKIANQDDADLATHAGRNAPRKIFLERDAKREIQNYGLTFHCASAGTVSLADSTKRD